MCIAICGSVGGITQASASKQTVVSLFILLICQIKVAQYFNVCFAVLLSHHCLRLFVCVCCFSARILFLLF